MKSTLIYALLAVAVFAAGCSSTLDHEGTRTNANDFPGRLVSSQAGPSGNCCETNLPVPYLRHSSSVIRHSLASSPSPYVSAWLATAERTAAPDVTFQDQSGRSVRLRDFRGAPMALSFAYTRCQNQRKCPAVARSLAKLQTLLGKSPVTPRPFVALITYDPEYDTPEILTRFAEHHGIGMDSRTILLRPEADMAPGLFRALDVSVNYGDGLVNVHGIQLILLDKEGRLARTYHSLMWDNNAVVQDLARLAAE